MKLSSRIFSRWISSILIVFVVITSLGFVKYQQIMAAIAFGESFPEPSASIASTLTESLPYARSTKVIGQLRATQELMVRNEYPGEITYVGFQPGDIVQQGQVLVGIDTSIEEADLKAAKSRLKLAELTHSRMKKLLAQNRVSEDEVDSAEADISVTQSQVRNLEIVISKKTIKAPFTGQVGLNEFQQGELLAANTDITSLIAVNGDIWVDFAVPQTLPQPAIGDDISVEIVAARRNRFEARVIAKDAAINVSSRQQNYRAVLDNSKGLLSHNQLVSVYVSEASVEVVVVPTNAITRNHFGEFVYRLEKDDQQNWRAKAIKVELGERIGDQHIVLSGLKVGEFIATEGAFKLQENLLVYTRNTAEQGTVGGAL